MRMKPIFALERKLVLNIGRSNLRDYQEKIIFEKDEINIYLS